MGTITKRGNSYRAIIRKKGHKTLTKTFSKKALAKRWVQETEYAIERKKIPGEGDFGEILDRYYHEIYKSSGESRAVKTHIRRFAKELAGVRLADLTVDWWVEWARSLNVSPASRVRYFTVVTTALATAESLWNINVPWADVRRAKKLLWRLRLFGHAKPRETRVTDEQIEAVKQNATTGLPLADIVELAVWTGLRESEISRLQWADLDEEKRLILVRDRKHPRAKRGNHQWIPLLGPAFDILKRQPRTDDRIFPWQPGTIGSAFRRTKKALKLDITFHDLRHEATSRLFEAGYAPQEVSLVTGHKDWNMLRRYTHLRPESLHDGPLRGKESPAGAPGK